MMLPPFFIYFSVRRTHIAPQSFARAREKDHDELLMNSLKAALVWGHAGIAQLVQSSWFVIQA